MTDQEKNPDVERPGQHDRGRRVMAGAVLVIAGLGLLALQTFEGLSDATVLMFIASLFIAGYFVRRTYGLLVAGSVIFGVGLGQIGQEIFDVSGDVVPMGIGIGFLLIYVIDRITRGETHFWPLIPGGILLVIGLSSIGGSFADAASFIWPALLIVGGIVLLVGANRRRE
jgi:hypothetical protein